MKKLIIFFLIFTATSAFTQNASCCAAPEKFAAFSEDIAFVNMHDEPLPFNYISEKGEMINFKCADGKDAGAFAIKSTSKSNKYLFVFHEWWGLNDYIKLESEKLYKDLGGDVNILAIDLYDGKVAITKDSAGNYMKNLDQKRAITIIEAALDHAGKKAEIVTIGWCMGGAFSLQAGIAADEKALGSIMYYGFPETDTAKLSKLNADVLMIWPNKDKWITASVVDQFKADMLALNKPLKVEEYTADHAFANPSNPKHNAELAADAYAKSLIFIKSKFNMK